MTYDRKPLILLLAFTFSTFLFSQQKITITLSVDTVKFDPSDMESSCSFTAYYSKSGRTIEWNEVLEDFIIDAQVGDEIFWEGISESSADDIIDIKKIKRENNSQIFKRATNYGKKLGHLNKETVEAQILYDTENQQDYKYSIFFKINGKGRTFKIDPKIKVGTSKK